MMVVWAIDKPRSAIISTRSRKLSLKRRYHLTHKTIISRSKCRPSNSSSKPGNPAITPPPTHQTAGRIERPVNCTRALSIRHLQYYPLDLIERDLIVAPIIEFRRARALMRCHLLRVLQKSTIEQIDGDAGRPERVA